MGFKRKPAADPYWLTAKYVGKCSRCGETINRGSEMFYFPNSRTALCGKEECGMQESRNFSAALFDERGF